MNGTTGVGAKVTMVALVIATLLGVVVMAYAEEGYDCPNGAVTVLPDDTLWGIAEVYCNSGDVRAIVHDMKIQNPHIGDTLYPGDELRLPTAEEASTKEIIVLAGLFGMVFSLPITIFASIMGAALVTGFQVAISATPTLRKLGLVVMTLIIASVTAILVIVYVKGILLGLELPWESVALGSGLISIWMAAFIPIYLD